MKTRSRTIKAIVSTLSICAVIWATCIGTGCVSGRVSPGNESAGAEAAALRDKWGIEITSLRMSGHGRLIDFRYRVLDPEKAAVMGDRKVSPSMIEQATGTKLVIPNTPKLGPLRQSAMRLEKGKVYFMLFANSGRLVKSGSQVTIVIGDFKVRDLTVE
ncbi:MAG: hypothetical protein WCN95_06500 [bacterium]